MINFLPNPPTDIKIDFENNACFSNETIKFENGLKYCGQMKNGLPDGIGKVINSYGDIIYDGQFVNGLREGNVAYLAKKKAKLLEFLISSKRVHATITKVEVSIKASF